LATNYNTSVHQLELKWRSLHDLVFGQYPVCVYNVRHKSIPAFRKSIIHRIGVSIRPEFIVQRDSLLLTGGVGPIP